MIDDDLTMCDYIGQIVKSLGYDFEFYNKAEGGLEEVVRQAPDLIILDLHLPDGNGLHVCKEIQQDQRTNGIPIIILTTREFNIEREMAFQAGASAFIQKPLDYKKISSQLNKWLSPSLEIKFWGVRGSTPCANKENMIYGGNTTCVQVSLPQNDEYLIFDCGSGIRNLGNQIINKDKQATGRVFITHPHWDHIQGFPFFKPFYIEQNAFTIHMPEQFTGGCKDVLGGQMSYTYFPVTPGMLKADLKYETQKHHLQEYNGYTMEFMQSQHPVSTAIYKLHVGNKKIVFCPDNEIYPQDVEQHSPYLEHLENFVRDADILIHDGQYDRNIYPNRRGWGHSAWEEAVELGIRTNVKNLFLMHHDPDSTDNYLSNLDSHLQDEYANEFDSVQLAKEGHVMRLKIREETKAQ